MLGQLKDKMQDFFQLLTYEDALELLLGALQRIREGSAGLALLESDMRDDMVSNMIVMFVRMVTSAEIRRREDFFFPFVLVGGEWWGGSGGWRG